MRRNVWLIPIFLGLASAPFACGDDETRTGPGADPGVPCERDAECDDGDGCTFDFCIDGFCQNNMASNGPQPNEVQTDGDCLEIACRDGETVVENDDDDTPDDDIEDDCTIPVCDDGTPTTGPADGGEFCVVSDNMFGVCDGMGTCSCAPPTSDTRVFVDAENGSDSATNGAGRGACAYATLDYALSQATGEIVLTDSAYDSTNATFPITLTDGQYLRCDRDNDQVVTTITGSGTFGTGAASVVYTGTSNGIQWCIVDGASTADTCVAVTTEGSGEFNHWLYQSRVQNCATTGIEVTDAGNNLFMEENDVSSGGTQGLLFTGADKTGYLRNNTFAGNGTDIVCSDASPALGGDSNGGPTCSGCDNCPF